MNTQRQATKKRSIVRVAFSLTLGPAIWALHLAVVYSVHSFGCARDLFGTGQTRIIIVMATLCALIGIAGGVAATAPTRAAEQELSFERGVAIALAGLSVFGVLAGGATALLVPACAALR
jgi:hypothetical protein